MFAVLHVLISLRVEQKPDAFGGNRENIILDYGRMSTILCYAVAPVIASEKQQREGNRNCSRNSLGGYLHIP